MNSSSILSVTFDSNALENVINPERTQAKEFKEDYLKIHNAIKNGQIKGFFSDTWITLEGIESKNRCEILGNRKLISKTSSLKKTEITPITINISIGCTMKENKLHPKFEEQKNAALSLGLRALSGQPRLGDSFFVKDNNDFYANIPIDELIKFREKVGNTEIAIAKRCKETKNYVGQSRAFKLGLEYLERENLSNCLWYEGLRFAKKDEQEIVKRAISEWADGENIIRHIGYEIDVFCTNDMGKQSERFKEPSIFDIEHRQWLSEQYGVIFCNPSELVEKYL